MGQVPDEPFALFGQMTTADPSRSPAGTESAWAYTHLPQHITADAGPDGITGRWDAREQQAMADRIEAQVERFGPGFRTLIGARRILAPTTLQTMNENLHNGAINNGTAALHQQAVSAPPPAPAARRPPSRACTSPPQPPTRVEGSTKRPARTPPGQRSGPRGSTPPSTAPSTSDLPLPSSLQAVQAGHLLRCPSEDPAPTERGAAGGGLPGAGVLPWESAATGAAMYLTSSSHASCRSPYLSARAP